MLLNSILDTIGNTPTLSLNKIGKELACSLYVKCEFLNPAGSIKDRIAKAMIEDAQKMGILQPGNILIEATSGNTGIGLALAAAVKGYKIIITMPEKNSFEKQVILEALGAKIFRTPNLHREHPDSYIALAKRLNEEIPNSVILNQFANKCNPNIHYQTTANEIIEDFQGQLDMVVMSMGTGGTITGVAKRLKEYNSKIKIIGVDPEGSNMTIKTPLKSYLVEGIGSDFVPEIFDQNYIDQIIYSNDYNSFQMARRLIQEEGLLIGGSSGSAVWAMVQAAKSLKQGQRALAVLPDSSRNYLTKFIDNKWLIEHGLENCFEKNTIDIKSFDLIT